jgi:uncharacterized protein (TIGR02594 family)
MKTLEKLKLHNLGEIGVAEQKSLRGGGEWTWFEGNWTYMLNEVTVYGGNLGMVQNATGELGVAEYSGSDNNPRIQDYFNGINGFRGACDSTPWCSAFTNYITEKSGYEGTDSAMANSWYNWGSPTSNPQPGDIAISSNGGHVGIVKSIEGGIITIISGNYSDQVAESVCSGYSFRTGR